MRIKTVLTYYFLPIRLVKIEQPISIGEAVGKKALFYIAGHNAKWHKF